MARRPVLLNLLLLVAVRATTARRSASTSSPNAKLQEKTPAEVGWILTAPSCGYHDASTAGGRAFLLTNVPFAVAGLRLVRHAQLALGASLGVAGILSHNYHLTQLNRGADAPETSLALALDYGGAGAATAGVARKISTCGLTVLRARPALSACFALGAAAFVGGCFADGREPWQYLTLHGAWHVFTAAAVYQLAAL